MRSPLTGIDVGVEMPIEVPFEGDKSAPYYLIGEAPGKHEEEEGRPFVGSAGKILNRSLFEAGIAKHECRLANVMRIRPAGNDFSTFSEEQVAAGIDYLKCDIRECRPKVVIPMGNHALRALTGESGITEWRGSILWSKLLRVKVIPTVHPSFIQHGNWDWAPIIKFDLCLAREELDKEYEPPHYTLITENTFEGYMREMERLVGAEVVAFDLETTRASAGKNALITTVGFSDRPGYAISIPFDNNGEPVWEVKEELELMQAVRRVLEGPAKKVAFNSQFDVGVLLYSYGIHITNFWFDPMCGFHILYPELPKSLDFVRSFYTRYPYYGHYAHLGHYWFMKYNALDAVMAYECAMGIDKQMRDMGLREVYDRLTAPLIPVLMGMQLRGMKIDESCRVEAKAKLEEDMKAAQEELNALVGEEVDAHSPKSLRHLLYEKMGLPVKYMKGTGKVTTNEQTLTELSHKYPSKIFALILKVRECRKTISTYLDAPLVEGRIHTSYNIGGRLKESDERRVEAAPETGRISSSRSIIVGSGCIPGDVEVLTPTGWVRLDHFKEGSQAMQWSPTSGSLEWCTPILYQISNDQPMINITCTNHSCRYTLGHRLPIVARPTTGITTQLNKPLTVESAQEAFTRARNFYLPLSGYKSSTQVHMLPVQARFLAAVQADGTIERPGYIRAAFKKREKQLAFPMLATCCGLDVKEVTAREGYKRFAVSGAHWVTDLLGPDKQLGWWMLQLGPEAIEAFVTETANWDAHRRGRSWQYFTTSKQNAEIVQTLAHLCGHSATTRSVANRNPELFTVAIKPRAYCLIEKKHKSLVPGESFVYCLQTPSSFFLIRSSGLIAVTGNTNLQNIPRGVCRKMFVADEGKVLVSADLCQAELRVVAYLAEEDHMIAAFEQGKDIHQLNADNLPTGWMPHGQAYLNHPNPRRLFAKKHGHAFDYGEGIRAFATHADLSVAEASLIYNKYFSSYPRILLWQQQVVAGLRRGRVMTTPFGRRREFYWIWGQQLFMEAYAYVPQSTVADVLNIALVKMQKKIEWSGEDIQLLLQVHDSMILQCWPSLVPVVVEWMKDAFDIPIKMQSHTFTIPFDVKVGNNWEELEDWQEEEQGSATPALSVDTQLDPTTEPSASAGPAT